MLRHGNRIDIDVGTTLPNIDISLNLLEQFLLFGLNFTPVMDIHHADAIGTPIDFCCKISIALPLRFPLCLKDLERISLIAVTFSAGDVWGTWNVSPLQRLSVPSILQVRLISAVAVSGCDSTGFFVS